LSKMAKFFDGSADVKSADMKWLGSGDKKSLVC